MRLHKAKANSKATLLLHGLLGNSMCYSYKNLRFRVPFLVAECEQVLAIHCKPRVQSRRRRPGTEWVPTPGWSVYTPGEGECEGSLTIHCTPRIWSRRRGPRKGVSNYPRGCVTTLGEGVSVNGPLPSTVSPKSGVKSDSHRGRTVVTAVKRVIKVLRLIWKIRW